MADHHDGALGGIDDACDVGGVAFKIDVGRRHRIVTVARQVDGDRVVAQRIEPRHDGLPGPGALPGSVDQDEGESGRGGIGHGGYL
jgi:hypothetical protein